MDMFKNYKFGDITKGVTKTVGSGVAHVGSGVLQGTKVAGTGVAASTKIVGDTVVKSGRNVGTWVVQSSDALSSGNVVGATAAVGDGVLNTTHVWVPERWKAPELCVILC